MHDENQAKALQYIHTKTLLSKRGRLNYDDRKIGGGLDMLYLFGLAPEGSNGEVGVMFDTKRHRTYLQAQETIRLDKSKRVQSDLVRRLFEQAVKAQTDGYRTAGWYFGDDAMQCVVAWPWTADFVFPERVSCDVLYDLLRYGSNEATLILGWRAIMEGWTVDRGSRGQTLQSALAAAPARPQAKRPTDRRKKWTGM
jgi:hypothetical protein